MSSNKRNPLWYVLFLLAVLIIIVMGWILGWFSEAVEEVREEFSPSELLRKYEWFKDTAADLDAKQANIKVFGSRMESLEESYGDIPRNDWDRTDKEQYNLWVQEQAGVISSYNLLAAEYNSQMAKFNWRFANAGELPEGATDPVPREFRSYEESLDS